MAVKVCYGFALIVQRTGTGDSVNSVTCVGAGVAVPVALCTFPCCAGWVGIKLVL